MTPNAGIAAIVAPAALLDVEETELLEYLVVADNFAIRAPPNTYPKAATTSSSESDPELEEDPGFVLDEPPALEELDPAPDSEFDPTDPEPGAPMPPLATASGEQSRSQVLSSKCSLASGHNSLKNMVHAVHGPRHDDDVVERRVAVAAHAGGRVGAHTLHCAWTLCNLCFI
ncbi:hypothetical protein PpBr36_06860 [Pyricularia pennisetigena]|uniref:hypothetical protein n=1 Tax=Pyricularia pennisetigena TaxID=1578925 RepID=UPI0011541C66|nr:hypothetical protein PpBr36_06860 [Pyricularia pennisetigena]TLS25686.1 hypothetical protein PpBr36_06860 [Pyricularia pennisetigena]